VRTNRWLLGLAMSVSVVALAACGSQGDDAKPHESSAAAEQSPGADSAQKGKDSQQDQGSQQGKPNTKDIPEVVAEVNGEKIKKDEFVPLFETQYQQMQMQAQQSGQPVNEKDLKKQTAENLVSTKVLTQEADKRDISVSDKDIDKGLKESAQQGQMSEKDFLKAMKKQGMDEEKVRSELSNQLKIEKLIEDEYGEFKVSGEEIGQAYEQAKSQQEQMAQQGGQQQEMPSIDKMRPQLKEQVKQQKSQKATQKFAKKLRKQADVTIHL
jgi:peptidyl-prolyl cis-trans isomerase SurA